MPLLEWISFISCVAEQMDQVLGVKRADFGRAIVPAVGNVIGVMAEIFQV